MQNPNAWRLDQEYLAIVDDLLQHEEVQQLAQYTQHHFSNRLRHSISVSYQSYVIAKKLALMQRRRHVPDCYMIFFTTIGV